MAIEDSVVEALRSKHSEVWTLSVGGYDFAFKMPSEDEYERFTGKVADSPKEMPSAARRLARDCIVHPSQDRLTEIFAKRPGLPLAIVEEILPIAGGKNAGEAVKL